MGTIRHRSVQVNQASSAEKGTVDLDIRLRAKGLRISSAQIAAISAAVLAFAVAVIQFHLRR